MRGSAAVSPPSALGLPDCPLVKGTLHLPRQKLAKVVDTGDSDDDRGPEIKFTFGLRSAWPDWGISCCLPIKRSCRNTFRR
jgi:hypothetical protein